MTQRLTHKAPNRDWYQLPCGMWDSRPWTKQARLDAQQGGAWFAGEGQHEYAKVTPTERSDVTPDVIGDEMGLDSNSGNPLSELMGNLSPSERSMLLEELRR